MIRFLCALILAFVVSVDAYTYCHANDWLKPIDTRQSRTNLTLQFVQVITRHGDRTTLTQLPTDNSVWDCSFNTYMLPSVADAPTQAVGRLYRKSYLKNREVIKGNCAEGALTETGYQQHLKLGAYYRSRYIDTLKFLNPVALSSNELYVRSTDVTRTLQSAQGNLLGLYPVKFTGQPAAVVDQYTVEAYTDNMTPNNKLCPQLDVIGKQIEKSAEYVAFMNAQQPFLAKIAPILNLTVSTLPQFDDLMDALLVLTCSNKTLPQGITPAIVAQVFDMANEQYNFYLNNSDFITLGIGSFLQELVDKIGAKISGDPDFKYMYYSGHDTTIAPLAVALGVYDWLWPPYASHIEIELWHDAGAKNWYVSIAYQGTFVTMPGCSSEFCPVQTFIDNCQKFLPLNFAEQCKVNQHQVRRPVKVA